MTNDDLILRTITPTTHDLGGFKVHRTLPVEAAPMVGPFIFFDQMGPAHLDIGTGIDVRPHPHINLSTVTYLFAGAIDHRDSLGTFARIEPGAVNLMTAGPRHRAFSERSPGDERAHGPELSGIQTWLGMPEDKEEIDPAFEHVAKAALPVIDGARVARADHHGEPVGPDRADHDLCRDDLRRHPARTRREHSRSTRAPTSARCTSRWARRASTACR